MAAAVSWGSPLTHPTFCLTITCSTLPCYAHVSFTWFTYLLPPCRWRKFAPISLWFFTEEYSLANGQPLRSGAGGLAQSTISRLILLFLTASKINIPKLNVWMNRWKMWTHRLRCEISPGSYGKGNTESIVSKLMKLNLFFLADSLVTWRNRFVKLHLLMKTGRPIENSLH